MARARRAAPCRRWPVRLATVLAGAVLVVSSAVVGYLKADQPAEQSASQPATGPGAAAGSATSAQTSGIPTPSADPTACEAEVASGETMIAAIRIATRHWQQHVQSWTDLLVHKSTAARTQAIFDQTTDAGPADLKRLADADAAYARHRGGCAALTGGAARGCQQRVTALDAAAVPGHGASNEWRLHLAAMAAAAAGKLSGVHARHAWEVAYRTAPKNLNAFEAADAGLRRAPACDPG